MTTKPIPTPAERLEAARIQRTEKTLTLTVPDLELVLGALESRVLTRLELAIRKAGDNRNLHPTAREALRGLAFEVANLAKQPPDLKEITRVLLAQHQPKL